jgi:hypothetical protein
MSSRFFCKQVSCVILCTALLAPVASAGGPRQLVAPVEATNGVAIAGVPAQTHDALFAGDVLSTSEGASALIRFSPLTQATVLQASSVQFELDSVGRPVAKISSGTVSARVSTAKMVIIQTAKYMVEPEKDSAAVYLVGVLPNQRTIVAARRGDVSITEARSGETYVLRAGRYIVVDASALGLPGQEQEQNKQAPGKPAGQAVPPSPPPQPQPKPPAKPAKQPWHIGSLSHGASIAVILGVAAGGAAGAVAAAAGGGGGGGGQPASPSAP